MEESSPDKDFEEYVKRKGLLIALAEDVQWERIQERSYGAFSFSGSVDEMTGVVAPALIIIANHAEQDKIFFGYTGRAQKISTFDKRMKVQRSVSLEIPSATSLVISRFKSKGILSEVRNLSGFQLKKIEGNDATNFIFELYEEGFSVSSVSGILKGLMSPDKFSSNASIQHDGIRMALKTFGIDPNSEAAQLETHSDKETSLENYRLIEDRVIEHDARSIDGLDLTASDITGRAVFEQGVEKLEIITANRGALEQSLGVDLIYDNVKKNSIVLVQYKMMEKEGDKWRFRIDEHMEAQIEKMDRLPKNQLDTGRAFRLNSSPCYLKFVRRNSPTENVASCVLHIDHFNKEIAAGTFDGPMGGKVFDYEKLDGHYLGATEFTALVRRGYIGSSSDETNDIRKFITESLQSGRALVFASHSKNKR